MVHTLLEAIALVVLVVILFLQTWRASIIPLLAVPVSIVGTFALLLVFGYSINALSLFGMVLAIGIVVDDAIVVVENVERNIAAGLTPARGDLPRHAGSERPHHRHRADAVRGVRAAGLHDRPDRAVLAVRHDHRHLDGDLGLQLADPVAGAVGHPAQGPSREARLADPWHEPRLRPLLQLVQQHVRPRLGILWRGRVRRDPPQAGAMGVYALLVAATIGVSYLVPGGFVPAQDKQYLIGFTQLPNGASLDRTDAVIRRMSDIALKEPGVQSAIAFPGLSINGFTNSSSAGIVFVMLKPFNERKGAALSGNAIAGSLNQKFAAIQDAFIAVFPPRP